MEQLSWEDFLAKFPDLSPSAAKVINHLYLAQAETQRSVWLTLVAKGEKTSADIQGFVDDLYLRIPAYMTKHGL